MRVGRNTLPRFLVRAGLLGGALLAAATVADANVFADAQGRDPRVNVARRDLAPVGVVGVLDPATKKVFRSGTGFLVGPCHVMTAGHAAAPQLKARANLRFFVGAAPDGYAVELAASGGGEAGDGGDWALLLLPACPGLQRGIGWMGVDARPWTQLVGGRVAAASFPFDREVDQVAYEGGCMIRAGSAERRLMAADCSATGGASGAPLFWIDGEGRPVAVAMIVAVFGATPGMLPQFDFDHATIAISLSDALTRHPSALGALVEDRRKGPNPVARSTLSAPTAPPRSGP